MVALGQTGVLVISGWTEPGDDAAVTFRARIKWSMMETPAGGETVVATREDALAVVSAWLDGLLEEPPHPGAVSGF